MEDLPSTKQELVRHRRPSQVWQSMPSSCNAYVGVMVSMVCLVQVGLVTLGPLADR